MIIYNKGTRIGAIKIIWVIIRRIRKKEIFYFRIYTFKIAISWISIKGEEINGNVNFKLLFNLDRNQEKRKGKRKISLGIKDGIRETKRIDRKRNK